MFIYENILDYIKIKLSENKNSNMQGIFKEKVSQENYLTNEIMLDLISPSVKIICRNDGLSFIWTFKLELRS